MRIYVAIVVLFMMVSHSSNAADQRPKLLVNKLDAGVVTKKLPLSSKQKLESGSGKLKQVWRIKGQQVGHFEIIGNNQDDADNVGWSCSEYDKQGNRIIEIRPERFCHKFLVNVLRNVVDQPENLAKQLLRSAKQSSPQAAVEKFGDISIETDGEFYFLRRISRM